MTMFFNCNECPWIPYAQMMHFLNHNICSQQKEKIMKDSSQIVTEEDMKVRLWGLVLQDLRTLSTTHPNVLPFLKHLESASRKSLNSRIYIDETVVYCGDKSLDLSRSDMLLEVFRTFRKFPNQQVDRLTLISHVYFDGKIPNSSIRHLDCLNHNIVKLISRSRKLANETFTDENQLSPYEWFPYDPVSQSWRLYRFRESITETLADEMSKIFKY
jgi:hypothetical protein